MCVSRKWIVCLVLLLIIQIAANFSDYKVTFQDDHFLMEGVFQVIGTDLDNDNVSEMAIAGKNYIGRELFVYWATIGPDFKPVIKWQSPNLFEDRSIIWIAAGKFTGDKNQLLVITETQAYIYELADGGLTLVKQEKQPFDPLTINAGITSADLNGDGRSELAVAKVGRITSKNFDGMIQVWQFKDGKPEIVAQSASTLGNIRSIAAGDIDGDGKGELFVEEGPGTSPGRVHLLSLNDNKLTERYISKNFVNGAVFAMKVRSLPEGQRLLTASDNGKLDIWMWDKSALVAAERERQFNSGFVDVDAMDLNNDQIPELLLVGYPQRLMILSK